MPRHIPQRSCIVCGLKAAKRDLHRIVRRPDGTIEIDLSGRAPGRGAYLCGAEKCWTAALKRGRLAGALSRPIDAGAQARLQEQIKLMTSSSPRRHAPSSVASDEGAR